uniref:Uncharacterized protein n=1 Tax=Glossina palpalis gambiensis TaxID=67801 RepID=A0A1B0ANB5_9MUSC
MGYELAERAYANMNKMSIYLKRSFYSTLFIVALAVFLCNNIDIEGSSKIVSFHPRSDVQKTTTTERAFSMLMLMLMQQTKETLFMSIDWGLCGFIAVVEAPYDSLSVEWKIFRLPNGKKKINKYFLGRIELLIQYSDEGFQHRAKLSEDMYIFAD